MPLSDHEQRLLEYVEAGSVDLVLCHGVLEMADDPAAGLAVVADVLRPGGVVSLLAANRTDRKSVV